MKKRLKKIIPVIACLLFSIVAEGGASPTAVQITPSSEAPNIIKITPDSIFLVSGYTYRYTVDTPENQGLVSTGINVGQLGMQLQLSDHSALNYNIYDSLMQRKENSEMIASGDKLEINLPDKGKRLYTIGLEKKALTGKLILHNQQIRKNTNTDLMLDFIAGQRTPKAFIQIDIPKEICVTMENTTVNVIGRGEVKLSDLDKQSIGRTGTNYSYKQVGQVSITETKQGQIITFSNIDLRPFNGIDLRIKINNITIRNKGNYIFKAMYKTSEPEIVESPAGSAMETAILQVSEKAVAEIPKADYTKKTDIKLFGVKGDGLTDDTDSINAAIKRMNCNGGGILRFSAGKYNVRTIRLKSNVWLYIEKNAVIQALLGGDAPEPTWFSDRAYRSGLSPTDGRPYEDPENYLTKQDVGHTFFHNSMFFAEREDNIKIIGNGRITGNGNLVTTDKVMDNPPEKRCDKMFTFKLCTNIEIGGIENGKDLWYDSEKDAPYYIEGDKKNQDTGNMLNINQGGHFVLLATGTDSLNVHDTYFGKENQDNVRDIYDFMACRNVVVTNIYSKVSSDDIVKPGSDCSLGFTRPARNYKIRNIIGDTNCNLFQIGSETADDIQDLYIDNIYVLGANKAGFSISTNDGGHIKNVYLNSGKTGIIHSRSKMLRTHAPFFISISNRARVLGADVKMFTFNENGKTRKELLCTNVNIGSIENIIINGVDISEVYGGSSFRSERWKPYDGSQRESTPIISGYKLPDSESVEGGLNFRLPNGLHTGYITNVQFTDVNLTVKGGHPEADAALSPPEIGVGRYNVGDFGVLPAYGFWVRHVKGFKLKNCNINYETLDNRSAVVLDDVFGAGIEYNNNKIIPN